MFKKQPPKLRSVIVSYRRQDAPIVTSRVGYGDTYADAIEDADRQLTDGVWKRLVVSTRKTIETDLKPSTKRKLGRRLHTLGEGVVVRVEKRVSTVFDND